MPSPKEIIEVSGRTVAISNPGKVYFPETGHTKLDVVRYYLSVADGALRGVNGRPMVLKRFVDGASGVAGDGGAEVPVRPVGGGGCGPRRRGPGLGGQPGLHRHEPAPGPGG